MPAYSAPRLRLAIVASLCSALMAGCASAPSPDRAAPTPVPELRPGVPAGYLGKDLPDSLVLLPPPPAEGSAAFRQDQAISRAARKLRGTARYALATSDADLHPAHAAGAFACALGVPISPQDSPRLYLLLQRTMVDAGLATYSAKNHYQRVRPFVHYRESTCAPADEAALRKDGSYPSGHTAIGWAWALVLTQLQPARANPLLARGRSFGESRLVCNAHWQSDVLEGRAVAAGAVARLQADATFRADLAAARGEVEALQARAAQPAGDCAAEAAALAIRIPGVL
ncbi:phosphatase PAP2 family protein [Lysobacter cavernae]|uniref:Acid phosphatase n=1 Tax=Lysobacter cavernae TaxID=1685901 RepID=A0ABV7RRH2_9GAMM